ncbi:MAG: glycosyltransferase family 4 protein [Actinomycetes bacterium]
MTSPLKIALIVHHQLELGTGAAGSTLTLAAALRHRGHMVDVIGLELVGAGDSTLNQMRFPWKVAKFLRGAIKDQAYDIVDASTGDYWLVTMKEVAATPTVFVTRSHGLEPLAVAARRRAARSGELRLRWRYRLYHGGWRLTEVRRSIGVADLKLVLNLTEKAYLTEILGVRPASVVITAPVAGQAFDEIAPTSPRPYRLLVVGGQQWRKGATDHAVVVETLLRSDPDLEVTWLGIATAPVAHDLVHRVRCIERYEPEEFGQILDTHGVLLSLTRFEGLPVVMLEAMSHGVCVVANAVPGPVDLLIGGAGILVKPGDLNEGVRAVQSLRDDDFRAQMGTAAHLSVQKFRPDRVVDFLVENYHEARKAKLASLHS